MTQSPGTWRRLKMASEARRGHPLPRVPDPELVRLLGLLAAIRDGRGLEAVGDDGLQERLGEAERAGLQEETLIEACMRIAKRVDVGPFL